MSLLLREASRPDPAVALFMDVWRLSIRLNGKPQTAFQRLGVGRVQAYVLLYLGSVPDQTTTIRQLADDFQPTAATLNLLIRCLEASGLVLRQYASEEDHEKQVVLTDKGQALLPKLQQAMGHILPFHRLSAEKVMAARTLLAQLLLWTDSPNNKRRRVNPL